MELRPPDPVTSFLSVLLQCSKEKRVRVTVPKFHAEAHEGPMTVEAVNLAGL